MENANKIKKIITKNQKIEERENMKGSSSSLYAAPMQEASSTVLKPKKSFWKLLSGIFRNKSAKKKGAHGAEAENRQQADQGVSSQLESASQPNDAAAPADDGSTTEEDRPRAKEVQEVRIEKEHASEPVVEPLSEVSAGSGHEADDEAEDEHDDHVRRLKNALDEMRIAEQKIEAIKTNNVEKQSVQFTNKSDKLKNTASETNTNESFSFKYSDSSSAATQESTKIDKVDIKAKIMPVNGESTESDDATKSVRRNKLMRKKNKKNAPEPDVGVAAKLDLPQDGCSKFSPEVHTVPDPCVYPARNQATLTYPQIPKKLFRGKQKLIQEIEDDDITNGEMKELEELSKYKLIVNEKYGRREWIEKINKERIEKVKNKNKKKFGAEAFKIAGTADDDDDDDDDVGVDAAPADPTRRRDSGNKESKKQSRLRFLVDLPYEKNKKDDDGPQVLPENFDLANIDAGWTKAEEILKALERQRSQGGIEKMFESSAVKYDEDAKSNKQWNEFEAQFEAGNPTLLTDEQVDLMFKQMEENLRERHRMKHVRKAAVEVVKQIENEYTARTPEKNLLEARCAEMLAECEQDFDCLHRTAGSTTLENDYSYETRFTLNATPSKTCIEKKINEIIPPQFDQSCESSCITSTLSKIESLSIAESDKSLKAKKDPKLISPIRIDKNAKPSNPPEVLKNHEDENTKGSDQTSDDLKIPTDDLEASAENPEIATGSDANLEGTIDDLKTFTDDLKKSIGDLKKSTDDLERSTSGSANLGTLANERDDLETSNEDKKNNAEPSKFDVLETSTDEDVKPEDVTKCASSKHRRNKDKAPKVTYFKSKASKSLYQKDEASKKSHAAQKSHVRDEPAVKPDELKENVRIQNDWNRNTWTCPQHDDEKKRELDPEMEAVRNLTYTPSEINACSDDVIVPKTNDVVPVDMLIFSDIIPTCDVTRGDDAVKITEIIDDAITNLDETKENTRDVVDDVVVKSEETDKNEVKVDNVVDISDDVVKSLDEVVSSDDLLLSIYNMFRSEEMMMSSDDVLKNSDDVIRSIDEAFRAFNMRDRLIKTKMETPQSKRVKEAFDKIKETEDALNKEIDELVNKLTNRKRSETSTFYFGNPSPPGLPTMMNLNASSDANAGSRSVYKAEHNISISPAQSKLLKAKQSNEDEDLFEMEITDLSLPGSPTHSKTIKVHKLPSKDGIEEASVCVYDCIEFPTVKKQKAENDIDDKKLHGESCTICEKKRRSAVRNLTDSYETIASDDGLFLTIKKLPSFLVDTQNVGVICSVPTNTPSVRSQTSLVKYATTGDISNLTCSPRPLDYEISDQTFELLTQVRSKLETFLARIATDSKRSDTKRHKKRKKKFSKHKFPTLPTRHSRHSLGKYEFVNPALALNFVDNYKQVVTFAFGEDKQRIHLSSILCERHNDKNAHQKKETYKIVHERYRNGPVSYDDKKNVTKFSGSSSVYENDSDTRESSLATMKTRKSSKVSIKDRKSSRVSIKDQESIQVIPQYRSELSVDSSDFPPNPSVKLPTTFSEISDSHHPVSRKARDSLEVFGKGHNRKNIDLQEVSRILRDLCGKGKIVPKIFGKNVLRPKRADHSRVNLLVPDPFGSHAERSKKNSEQNTISKPRDDTEPSTNREACETDETAGNVTDVEVDGSSTGAEISRQRSKSGPNLPDDSERKPEGAETKAVDFTEPSENVPENEIDLVVCDLMKEVDELKCMCIAFSEDGKSKERTGSVVLESLDDIFQKIDDRKEIFLIENDEQYLEDLRYEKEAEVKREEGAKLCFVSGLIDTLLDKTVETSDQVLNSTTFQMIHSIYDSILEDVFSRVGAGRSVENDPVINIATYNTESETCASKQSLKKYLKNAIEFMKTLNEEICNYDHVSRIENVSESDDAEPEFQHIATTNTPDCYRQSGMYEEEIDERVRIYDLRGGYDDTRGTNNNYDEQKNSTHDQKRLKTRKKSKTVNRRQIYVDHQKSSDFDIPDKNNRLILDGNRMVFDSRYDSDDSDESRVLSDDSCADRFDRKRKKSEDKMRKAEEKRMKSEKKRLKCEEKRRKNEEKRMRSKSKKMETAPKTDIEDVKNELRVLNEEIGNVDRMSREMSDVDMKISREMEMLSMRLGNETFTDGQRYVLDYFRGLPNDQKVFTEYFPLTMNEIDPAIPESSRRQTDDPFRFDLREMTRREPNRVETDPNDIDDRSVSISVELIRDSLQNKNFPQVDEMKNVIRQLGLVGEIKHGIHKSVLKKPRRNKDPNRSVNLGINTVVRDINLELRKINLELNQLHEIENDVKIINREFNNDMNYDSDDCRDAVRISDSESNPEIDETDRNLNDVLRVLKMDLREIRNIRKNLIDEKRDIGEITRGLKKLRGDSPTGRDDSTRSRRVPKLSRNSLRTEPNASRTIRTPNDVAKYLELNEDRREVTNKLQVIGAELYEISSEVKQINSELRSLNEEVKRSERPRTDDERNADDEAKMHEDIKQIDEEIGDVNNQLGEVGEVMREVMKTRGKIVKIIEELNVVKQEIQDRPTATKNVGRRAPTPDLYIQEMLRKINAELLEMYESQLKIDNDLTELNERARNPEPIENARRAANDGKRRTSLRSDTIEYLMKIKEESKKMIRYRFELNANQTDIIEYQRIVNDEIRQINRELRMINGDIGVLQNNLPVITEELREIIDDESIRERLQIKKLLEIVDYDDEPRTDTEPKDDGNGSSEVIYIGSKVFSRASGMSNVDSGDVNDSFGVIYIQSKVFSYESNETGAVDVELKASNDTSEVVYIETEPTNQSERIYNESVVIDVESGIINDESGPIKHESRLSIDETGVIHDETAMINDESGIIKEETLIIHRETGVLDDETEVLKDKTEVLNETEVLEDKTGVLNEETGVLDDETEVLEDKTEVLDDETEVLEDKTEVLDEETEVLKDKTGVLNEETEVLKDNPGALNDETKVINDESGLIIHEPRVILDDALGVIDEMKVNDYESGTVSYESGVNYHEPEINKYESEAVCFESGINNHESGAISCESVVNNHESGALSYEPEVNNHESGAISYESRLNNHESGAVSCESKSMNYEPEVNKYESTTIIYESGAISYESVVKNYESGAINDESVPINDESIVINYVSCSIDKPGEIDDQSKAIYDEPGVINDKSGVINDESGVINDESRVIIDEPGVVIVEPGVKYETEVIDDVKNYESIVVNEPGLINFTIEVMNDESVVKIDEPEVETVESEVKADESEVRADESEVKTDESDEIGAIDDETRAENYESIIKSCVRITELEVIDDDSRLKINELRVKSSESMGEIDEPIVKMDESLVEIEHTVVEIDESIVKIDESSVKIDESEADVKIYEDGEKTDESIVEIDEVIGPISCESEVINASSEESRVTINESEIINYTPEEIKTDSVVIKDEAKVIDCESVAVKESGAINDESKVIDDGSGPFNDESGVVDVESGLFNHESAAITPDYDESGVIKEEPRDEPGVTNESVVKTDVTKNVSDEIIHESHESDESLVVNDEQNEESRKLEDKFAALNSYSLRIRRMLQDARFTNRNRPKDNLLDTKSDIQRLNEILPEIKDNSRSSDEGITEMNDESRRMIEILPDVNDDSRKANEASPDDSGKVNSCGTDDEMINDDSRGLHDDVREVSDDSRVVNDDRTATDDSRIDSPRAIIDKTRRVNDNLRAIDDDTRRISEEIRRVIDDTRRERHDSRASPDDTQSVTDDSRVTTDDTRSVDGDTRILSDDAQKISVEIRKLIEDARTKSDDPRWINDEIQKPSVELPITKDDSRGTVDEEFQRTYGDYRYMDDDSRRVNEDFGMKNTDLWRKDDETSEKEMNEKRQKISFDLTEMSENLRKFQLYVPKVNEKSRSDLNVTGTSDDVSEDMENNFEKPKVLHDSSIDLSETLSTEKTARDEEISIEVSDLSDELQVLNAESTRRQSSVNFDENIVECMAIKDTCFEISKEFRTIHNECRTINDECRILMDECITQSTRKFGSRKHDVERQSTSDDPPRTIKSEDSPKTVINARVPSDKFDYRIYLNISDRPYCSIQNFSIHDSENSKYVPKLLETFYNHSRVRSSGSSNDLVTSIRNDQSINNLLESDSELQMNRDSSPVREKSVKSYDTFTNAQSTSKNNVHHGLLCDSVFGVVSESSLKPESTVITKHFTDGFQTDSECDLMTKPSNSSSCLKKKQFHENSTEKFHDSDDSTSPSVLESIKSSCSMINHRTPSFHSPLIIDSNPETLNCPTLKIIKSSCFVQPNESFNNGFLVSDSDDSKPYLRIEDITSSCLIPEPNSSIELQHSKMKLLESSPDDRPKDPKSNEIVTNSEDSPKSSTVPNTPHGSTISDKSSEIVKNSENPPNPVEGVEPKEYPTSFCDLHISYESDDNELLVDVPTNDFMMENFLTKVSQVVAECGTIWEDIKTISNSIKSKDVDILARSVSGNLDTTSGYENILSMDDTELSEEGHIQSKHEDTKPVDTDTPDDLNLESEEKNTESKDINTVSRKKSTSADVNVLSEDINVVSEKKSISEEENFTSVHRNVLSKDLSMVSEKKSISGENNIASVDINVLSEDMNVVSEKKSISEDKNIASIDINVLAEDINVVSGKKSISGEENITSADINVLSEDLNMVAEKKSISGENNIASVDINVVSEKNSLSGENKMASVDVNMLSEDLNITSGDNKMASVDINMVSVKKSMLGDDNVMSEVENVVSGVEKVVPEEKDIVSEVESLVLEVKYIVTEVKNVVLEEKNIVLKVKDVVLNEKNILSEVEKVVSEEKNIVSKVKNLVSEEENASEVKNVVSEEKNMATKKENKKSTKSKIKETGTISKKPSYSKSKLSKMIYRPKEAKSKSKVQESNTRASEVQIKLSNMKNDVDELKNKKVKSDSKLKSIVQRFMRRRKCKKPEIAEVIINETDNETPVTVYVNKEDNLSHENEHLTYMDLKTPTTSAMALEKLISDNKLACSSLFDSGYIGELCHQEIEKKIRPKIIEKTIPCLSKLKHNDPECLDEDARILTENGDESMIYEKLKIDIKNKMYDKMKDKPMMKFCFGHNSSYLPNTKFNEKITYSFGNKSTDNK